MSDKILKEGDDLLNNIISLNLEDENNFLNLVEKTFPLLPKPQKATQQFRVFRNTLAKRPVANSNLTAKLERVNSVVNEQAQDSKLVKINTTTFKIREKTDDLARDIRNLEISVDTKIDNTASDLQEKLDEILSLLNEMDKKLNSILNLLNTIESIKDDIIDEIKKILTYLKLNIEKPLINLQEQIDNLLKAIDEIKNKIERLLTGQDQILGGIGAILAALTGEAINPKNIKPALDNFKNKVKEAIKEWFKNTDEEIYKNSSDYICDKIVGESYIKYDASSLYMPTLIFKYKNKKIVDKKKYAQIKIRLNLASDDITDEVVDNLRQQIIQLSDVSYFSGNLRCLYVSQNRLFKTTIFCSAKTDAINLFKKLIPISKTSFLENNFSFTENSKRDHFQRKKQPLKHTKLNPSLKAYKSEMMLSSVFLQINGLDLKLNYISFIYGL